MTSDVLARRTFQKGDLIFLEGDPGDATYLVQQGKVELIKRGSSGMFETLAEVGPGQVFGELALLTNRPRAAGAHAVENCVLIAVERNQLDAKLKAADPFVQAMFRILAQNLLSVMDRKASASTGEKSAVDALAGLVED
jgi:CRP/FNR family cyclic AMP-dependent transcriptional regulator